MDIVVWITSGLLALAFLAAGATKALAPYEKLKGMMPWTADVGQPMTRFIGVAEALGGIGVVLPHLTGILPWLSIVAAFALALVQVLAIGFHVRRHEAKVLGGNVVLLLLALFVGIGLLFVL